MNIKKRILLLISIFMTLAGYSQNRTGISGTIVDAETKEPVIGVQVYFIATSNKASTIGTTTDFDGKFSLSTTEKYITVKCQMIGYKPELITLRAGQMKKGVTIELKPDVIGLQDVVVIPKKEKKKYKRKGNPAVELVKNVIAHKDSSSVKSLDKYTAETYSRMSFAVDNFHPDFTKKFWKQFAFAEKYIDTTGENHSMTIDVREVISNEYYQHHPLKEKKILQKKRIFGIEDIIGAETFEDNISLIFKDVDINEDNMKLFYNRFVSPLSSQLAVSYYQYYIQDTILLEGDSCIDLAFVPVNSESYSFTGHLYIVNDSTFKVKKYVLDIPQNINLNFVSNFHVEHSYKKLDNDVWAPGRTNTRAKFYIFKKKRGIIARQTKIYTDWDFDSEIDSKIFSSMTAEDATEGVVEDSTAVRLGMAAWDTLRPEPLTYYETSVYDLVEEFEANPTFNSLTVLANAITTEYVPTVSGDHMWDSKWDFGSIYQFLSWNMLEGVRLRLGGITTANVNPHWFFQGYVAFGTKDLRPKYNATLIYSFNEKKYHPYETYRHYLSVGAQYDVEVPCQETGILRRDHILMSIPTSNPTLGYNQYIFHAKLEYLKEWQNRFTIKGVFDFSHNEAAGVLKYDRITAYDSNGAIATTANVGGYFCYDAGVELRYSPGIKPYVDRGGNESPFSLDHDAPVLKLKHHIGYLDDRQAGGKGFIYNTTEISCEKRFWLASFGHIDTRLQIGMSWNQVPFTKLYAPITSTGIFLAPKDFNQLQPMEFMMDRYVQWHLTYFMKGWILNRIPGINRLRLRGVVSFTGVYGYLGKRNNPYLEGNEGLYKFPDMARYDEAGQYIGGYTSSPIGSLPYMELTAGLENILKFIRIDYIRRLTYNEYLLPDGIHRRKIGGWGRNGVKITVRFSF